MDLLGMQLTLLLGATVPAPAPRMMMEALQTVSVTHTDKGRSGFQITFQVGRSNAKDVNEHPLLTNTLIRPFNRIVLVVTLSGSPRVLFDGVITHYELSPGVERGTSTFTLTGEDLSLVMDQEEKITEHPGQDESTIVKVILGSYCQYGLLPDVKTPSSVETPLTIERVPEQHGTDLGYIKEMADRFGFVFYITPGPAPGTSTAYWGPPVRSGTPQKALSANMGQSSNVSSISFQDNWLAPTLVSGRVQDRTTNEDTSVNITGSTRVPLASQSGLDMNPPFVRKVKFMQGGLTVSQAIARAQGMTDDSVDEVVTATGELDAIRYGDLLQPRGLVKVRGTGQQHDGLYYVKSVTHVIRKEDYKQHFTLTREGIGALA